MSPLFSMRTSSLVHSFVSVSSAIGLLLASTAASLADPFTYPPDDSPIPDPPGARDDRPNGSTIPLVTRAYTPPSDASVPRDDHTGGGVRGCGDDIEALAPRLNFVGQTASAQPTFVWYNFSNDSDPIEFQLYSYEPDGSYDLVDTKQFEDSQQGYMAHTLPADKALDVGETYLWQVVLYCDQEFEQPGQYSSAEVEVVDLPADLAAELPSDSLERAQIYAQSGLWYDAMAEVYDAETPAEESLRQTLLLDLAYYEEQSDKDSAEELSEQLRAIAEM